MPCWWRKVQGASAAAVAASAMPGIVPRPPEQRDSMVETRFDVLGIGNAIVDVIARTDDDFLVRHEMRKGTMSLIVEEQAEHIYEAMGPAVEISGGSAANTIAGVASFGARA